MPRSSSNNILRNVTVALVVLLGLIGFPLDAQTEKLGTQPKTTVDFQTDVEEIFTKRGCNDSHCHGGVKGRGGFKLSHNALDPREGTGSSCLSMH